MKWYVLYTQHNHDRAVRDRLVHKGFEVYLPLLKVSRRSNGVNRETSVPLLVRRLFVHCNFESYTHLELISTPGVMHLLKDSRGEFLVVSDEEISTLQRISSAGVPFEKVAYQIRGQCVQMVEGPLRGVRGLVGNGSKMLIVPFHALGESVGVQIGRARVVPCEKV